MPGGYPGPLRDGFETEAVYIIISIIIIIIMITVYYHNVLCTTDADNPERVITHWANNDVLSCR